MPNGNTEVEAERNLGFYIGWSWIFLAELVLSIPRFWWKKLNETIDSFDSGIVMVLVISWLALALTGILFADSSLIRYLLATIFITLPIISRSWDALAEIWGEEEINDD